MLVCSLGVFTRWKRYIFINGPSNYKICNIGKLFVSSIVICTGHWSRIWYSFQVSQFLHIHLHTTLQWRHNGLDGVSTHQPHYCLFNRLFRLRSKKTSKLRVTGICAGNSPVTGEFPAQRASNAENVSIWWRHHGTTDFSHPPFYHSLPLPIIWHKITQRDLYSTISSGEKSDEHLPIEGKKIALLSKSLWTYPHVFFECLLRYTKPPGSCILCPYQISTKPLEQNKAQLYTCMQGTPVWFTG